MDQNLYPLLKNYKFICIGEMHGTKEPAEFLSTLVKLFVSNNKKVIVGMEIPDSLMGSFRQQPDSAGLLKTEFFSRKSDYGLESSAWFHAIVSCNQFGVTFCFFDNGNTDRDLGMHEKLADCSMNDSTAIVVTLTGNVHNKLLPYKNNNTMGCYLKERFGEKVFSVNHIYNGGTMYNRTSEGLALRTIPPSNNAFATATTFEKYFIRNIFSDTDGYSAYYYTNHVTASFPKTK